MFNVSDAIGGATDIVLFASIRSYISTRIDYFLESTLSGFFTIAGVICLTLLTLWIMIQGYLIVTGRSQSGIKGFIFSALRAYLIVAIATGVASTSGGLVRGLTDDLNDSISTVLTGDDAAAKCIQADAAFLGCKVDRAFTATQAIATFIGGIDTAGDPVLEDKKSRASTYAVAGAAGPGILAGSMILLYKFGMAMFIGFGPLFILCLLFKQTAPLFQKWLMYGISLMFANAMLAVVASIAMDLITSVAGALFISDKVFGASSQGIMVLATQQLGLGLVLSTLIMSVPPMAANFFQGIVGNFNGQSSLTGWMSPSRGGNGAAGAQGGQGAAGQTGGGTVAGGSGGSQSTPTQSAPTVQHGSRVAGQAPSGFSSDTIKPAESAAMAQSNTSASRTSVVPPAPMASSSSSAGGSVSGAESAATVAGSALTNASPTSSAPASSSVASSSGGQSATTSAGSAPAASNSNTAPTASVTPSQTVRPVTGGNSDVFKPKV